MYKRQGYGVLPEDDIRSFLYKKEDGSFTSVYHVASATKYFTINAAMSDMDKAKQTYRTGGSTPQYTRGIQKIDIPFKIHHF